MTILEQIMNEEDNDKARLIYRAYNQKSATKAEKIVRHNFDEGFEEVYEKRYKTAQGNIIGSTWILIGTLED